MTKSILQNGEKVSQIAPVDGVYIHIHIRIIG